MQKDYVITVFTMTHCPACVRLKRWLNANDIPFVEKDIITNKEYEKEFLNRGLRYAPTTFIEIGDKEIEIEDSSYKKIEEILLAESISQ